MARLELLPGVGEDFARIVKHLRRNDVHDAQRRLEQLVRALDVLMENPFIGRPARGDRRELVIGRGARGYVALYRFLPEPETVLVLAIRGQHEGRYRRQR